MAQQFTTLRTMGAAIGLSAILSATGAAQDNRYGAERDLGYDVYNMQKDLAKTEGRVTKLEGDLASLRRMMSQGSGHVSYNSGGGSTLAPTSNRSTDGGYHRVKSGDTLSSIARKHQVGVDRIIAENRITNPNALRVGQEIFIPGRKGSAASSDRTPAPRDPAPSGSPATHTVSAGDTLYSIGRRYGVSSDSIIRANGMANPNALRIGQRLSIPGATGTASNKPAPRQDNARPPAPQPAPKGGESEEVVAPDGYGFYQVEPGDTLHSIAISFGTNATELRRLNDLRNASLHVGDFLLVPVPDPSLYEG